MLRSVIAVLVIIIDTLILGTLVMILGIFNYKLAFVLTRIWAHIILKASGVRVLLRGIENLKVNEPKIIMANHASQFDIPALIAYLPCEFRFVAKKELLWIPVFGWAMYFSGHIVIDRFNKERAIKSIEKAGERIRKNSLSVLIFPEGQICFDGKLQSFKKGGFVLALNGRINILPVTIIGSRKVLPRGCILPAPGIIEIKIKPEITIKNYKLDEKEKLMKDVAETISTGLSVI